jgi:hypothetical protein
MAVLPGTPIVGTLSYDTNTTPSISQKGYAYYALDGTS